MLLFPGVDLFCGVDSVLLHTTCPNTRILVAFSHHRYFFLVTYMIFLGICVLLFFDVDFF